jgi:hypothetical protein
MVASVKNPIHFSVQFTVPHLGNLQLQRNSKTVPKLFLITLMQHGAVEYSRNNMTWQLKELSASFVIPDMMLFVLPAVHHQTKPEKTKMAQAQPEPNYGCVA